MKKHTFHYCVPEVHPSRRAGENKTAMATPEKMPVTTLVQRLRTDSEVLQSNEYVAKFRRIDNALEQYQASH